MPEPTRAQILAGEFTRPPQPGLRLLTVGIIDLGERLGLHEFQGKEARAARPPMTADERKLEETALVWLLDERNAEDMVYDSVESGGREWLFPILREYRRGLLPSIYALARQEMSLTNRALSAAAYEIQAKPVEPGTKAPPAPPPNS